MHEDNRFELGKNEIGTAGKRTVVQAVSQSDTVERSPEQ